MSADMKQDLIRAERELMNLWGIVRTRKQDTRNAHLIRKYERIESEIKASIKDLEKEYRAEAQNSFVAEAMK